MTVNRGTVVQTGVNVTTGRQIETNLNGDKALKVNALDIELPSYLAAGRVAVILTTDIARLQIEDNECLLRAVINPIGTVDASPRVLMLPVEQRLTVQPSLYVVVFSEGLAQVQTVHFNLFTETVPVKEIEFLRLQAGGA